MTSVRITAKDQALGNISITVTGVPSWFDSQQRDAIDALIIEASRKIRAAYGIGGNA